MAGVGALLRLLVMMWMLYSFFYFLDRERLCAASSALPPYLFQVLIIDLRLAAAPAAATWTKVRAVD